MHYNFVQAVEVTCGHNDRGYKRHYHYMPVLESLRAMLKQESFNPLLVEDGTLCDFTDGYVIRSNGVFASHPDSSKVMLFQDVFEVANPLGSTKQKHKV